MIANIEQKLVECYDYAIKNKLEDVCIGGKIDTGERCLIATKLNKKESRMDVIKFWLLSGKVLWENGMYYGDKVG